MHRTLVLRNRWAALAGLPAIEPEHGLGYIKQNAPAAHGGAVDLAPMPLTRESGRRPDSAALLAAAASPL